VHAPPHESVPLGQTQAPALQVWPAPHAVAQPPQWSGSLAGSVQVSPQVVCPGAVQAHAPFTHVCPAPQALPQAPQFAGSVSRLEHEAAQRCWPAAQPGRPESAPESGWPPSHAPP
jgi:hypothetical protein